MTTLIALLISLLGYGTPANFETRTQEELKTKYLEEGGNLNDWDQAVVAPAQN
ncbi:MAG: hypothetical protein JKY48_12515 [Flavobacteriales bacterium]|nr:hypothetical protein [Flavobacteriales bacterium]